MNINFGAAFHQLLVQGRFDRASHIRAQRFLILRRLRLAGIREVSCTYDAYGDSGNWEEVTIDSGTVVASDDLVSAIGNFVLDVAYHHHAGFENNEGGFGEVIWDIKADSITLDHADRYTALEHHYHEGL